MTASVAGIADALEHSQQARLVGRIDLREPLDDQAQRRAPDDRQPGNGGLDGHGVVTGQEFVEQGLGLTGTGGHGAAILPRSRCRMR